MSGGPTCAARRLIWIVPQNGLIQDEGPLHKDKMLFYHLRGIHATNTLPSTCKQQGYEGAPVVALYPHFSLAVPSLYPQSPLYQSLYPHCWFLVPSLYPHCTIAVPSLHHHCVLTAPSLHPHCILTALSLHPHCTLTAPSLHHHCTLTAPSLHPHCTCTSRQYVMCAIRYSHPAENVISVRNRICY